jgi:hypothetical protein
VCASPYESSYLSYKLWQLIGVEGLVIPTSWLAWSFSKLSAKKFAAMENVEDFSVYLASVILVNHLHHLLQCICASLAIIAIDGAENRILSFGKCVKWTAAAHQCQQSFTNGSDNVFVFG